jgi:hypothetical protein
LTGGLVFRTLQRKVNSPGIPHMNCGFRILAASRVRCWRED